MIYTNFSNKLINFINLSKLKKVAVSLSGGADSMCLTFLLDKFCRQNNIFLMAITIDHKLRVESTLEANKISEYLKKYDINHSILTWHHNEIKANIQNVARSNHVYRISRKEGIELVLKLDEKCPKGRL